MHILNLIYKTQIKKITMKKSYKLILLATGLIATGIAMNEAFPYVSFYSNNIENVSIEPNSDYTYKISSEGEITMSGVISSVPKEIPINLKILNPDGSTLWDGKSQAAPIYLDPKERNVQVIAPEFINPNSEGNLKVVITNLGDQQVVVTGGIHDSAFDKKYDSVLDAAISDEFFEILLYVILSALLQFVGVIIGIIGAIYFFKERKSMKNIN